MVKKFDDRNDGDDMMSGTGQALSREDRKNQAVLAMFKKQEKRLLRKEERGKKLVAQSEGGFEKPQNVDKGHSNSGVQNSSQAHKVSHRSDGRPGTTAHKHRTIFPFQGTSIKQKDVPPITVKFSQSVREQSNNCYFFKRKTDFEERQRQLIASQMQQNAFYMRQHLMLQQQMSFGAPHQQQSSLQAQMQMQQNNPFTARQMCQQGGLPHMMIQGLQHQHPNAFMMTAGTGGLYDPIIDENSGQASSNSSASKNDLQANNHLSVEGGADHPMHIPRPSMLMVQSAPQRISGPQIGSGRQNGFNPYMHQQTNSAGGSLMSRNQFITGTDSSELEDSSGSFVSGNPGTSPLNMLSQQQIGSMSGQIPPHLLQLGHPLLKNNQTITGHSNMIASQNGQQLQKNRSNEESEDDNNELELIKQRTREEQKRLKIQTKKFLVNDLGSVDTDAQPQKKQRGEEYKN